ncbi:MAG: CoA-binding protein, partial [Flavobacteriales bacterium]|nr:CoA-binding protein [Flavobacteriales bacterium]
MSQKVLVMGASLNPDRYSNKAIIKLKEFGHTIFAFGI